MNKDQKDRHLKIPEFALFARQHDERAPCLIAIVAPERTDNFNNGNHVAYLLSGDGSDFIRSIRPDSNWTDAQADDSLDIIAKKNMFRSAQDSNYIEVYARHAATGETPEEGQVLLMVSVIGPDTAKSMDLKSEHIHHIKDGQIISTQNCAQMAQGMTLGQVAQICMKDPVSGKSPRSTTSAEYTWAISRFNRVLAQLPLDESTQVIRALYKEHMKGVAEESVIPSSSLGLEYRHYLKMIFEQGMTPEQAIVHILQADDHVDARANRTRQRP